MIAAIQGPPGPPCRRLLRAGRQLPADRPDRCSVCWMSASISSSDPPTIWSSPRRAAGASIAPTAGFIPASRIGCFGPGGNLPADSVTHVSFFSQPETVDFLVNGLLGRPQPLNARGSAEELCPIAGCCVGAMADVAGTPDRRGTDAPVAGAAAAPAGRRRTKNRCASP